ncbi:glycosyltransferase family 2 [Drechmeria coniospora]|uniref:Glycosyltransferase family 2 n=1 Tax=Drechmeria coniospora TaxID=98403 RepID=A0A151GKA6_DRECN|nr:glycosyltransferase family 2 [Drechmeria coniospora]KYK57442.1 glycosyltransferase family 2 [Drechmeria coniospora]
MDELARNLAGIGASILLHLVPSPTLWRSTSFWAFIFWGVWIHRYLRLLVHCVSHWTYKSKPIPAKASFTNEDVTVVIPTIHHAFEELRPSLLSILACRPAELILVTTHGKRESLESVVNSLAFPNVRVMHTHIANKRLQVCEALPEVKTSITIMADDDVTWPSTMLPWILAPFEDPKIGGVGTSQRVKRERNASWTARMWNWLGAAYIERRNFEISATHNIDGGTSCMSGRTGAYRSEILSSHEFLEGFKNEKWRRWILNADDDNFVTRWLVGHQWKTWIQYNPECELETTLENGHKFLYQCTSQQPWCVYALHIATFTSLTFAVDPLLLASCWWATGEWSYGNRQYAFWSQFMFMFGFTKVVKLLGLFRRHPIDVVFLPASIIFGYLHGLIKLYALMTLNMPCHAGTPSRAWNRSLTVAKTSWGSRADADADDDQRLAPAPAQSMVLKTPPGSTSLILYNVRQKVRPMSGWTGDAGNKREGKTVWAAYESETPHRALRPSLPLLEMQEAIGRTAAAAH